MIKRVFVIVLDSYGIGNEPDAADDSMDKESEEGNWKIVYYPS